MKEPEKNCVNRFKMRSKGWLRKEMSRRKILRQKLLRMRFLFKFRIIGDGASLEK